MRTRLIDSIAGFGRSSTLQASHPINSTPSEPGKAQCYGRKSIANGNLGLASSSEETTSSSVSFLRLRSDSRCRAILRQPSGSGPWTDGYNSAYDTVTDRIWDNINKGVRSLE